MCVFLLSKQAEERNRWGPVGGGGGRAAQSPLDKDLWVTTHENYGCVSEQGLVAGWGGGAGGGAGGGGGEKGHHAGSSACCVAPVICSPGDSLCVSAHE